MSGTDDGAPRTLVCIPTYNEAENVRTVVSRVRTARPEVDVLIVDDDSPDGTGTIADGLATADARVLVLHRTEKAGLGVAYLAAFAWGLQHGYDVIVEMDADGSHRAQDLGPLLDAVAGGADLALGSRWVRGGRVENWSRHRRWLSRGGNVYARLMLRVPVTDATGGFRAFRAAALTELDLRDVASHGYCFQVDLVRRAHDHGLAIAEVPIVFVEREFGVSKMSGGIVTEALWRVTVWGIQRRLRHLVHRVTGRPAPTG